MTYQQVTAAISRPSAGSTRLWPDSIVVGRMKQGDLFGGEEQSDLFGEPAEPVVGRADPDKVRAELLLVLAQVRAAKTLPWPAARLRYHQTVFPQMSRWLPADEAAQLCFEFEAEVRRLLAA